MSAHRHAPLAAMLVWAILGGAAAAGNRLEATRPWPEAARVTGTDARSAASPLEATRLGQDGAGNLWAWNRDTSEIVVLGEDGPAARLEVSGASAVDVHHAWGVVAVVDHERAVAIVALDGTIQQRIPLEVAVKNVAWLGPNEVLIAPAAHEYLVGRLNVGTRAVTKWIGPVEPPPRSPGAYFARTTVLQVDRPRERIHALDSLRGEYRLFSFAGEELATAQIENPRRAELEEWLREVDAAAKAKRAVDLPAMWVLKLGLDEKGRAWTVQSCDPASGRAVLVRFEPGRQPASVPIDLDCCTYNMTVLGMDLIMAPSPRMAGDRRCSTERRLPDSRVGAAWAEVVPLRPGGTSRLVRSDSASEVAPGIRLAEPSVLCSGGVTLRVECAVHLTPALVPAAPSAEDGVILRGRLLLGEVPAAGASVAVLLAGLRANVPHRVPLELEEKAKEPARQVVADRQGHFELPPLAPAGYRLEIEWPGGAVTHTEAIAVPHPDRLRAEKGVREDGHVPFALGEFFGPHGVAIDLVVLDDAGQPVEGALVGAHQGPPADWRLFEGASDENGRARLSGLEAGEPVSVACWAPGHTRQELHFEVPPGGVLCSMSRLAVLRGRVEFEGDPLAGATAALSGREERSRSDPLGRFELSNIPPGEATLVVSAPGTRALRERVVLEPGEVLDLGDLELPPADEWTLRIVDRETAEPLDGALVEVIEPAGETAVADAEGLVALRAEPRSVVRIGSDPDYPAVEERLPEAPPPPDEPLELELAAGGLLRIQAWDEEGEPCRDCSVDLQCASRIESVTTDLNGSALTEVLPAGRCGASITEQRSVGRVVHVQGGREQVFVEIHPREIASVELGDRGRLAVLRFGEPLGEWRPSVRGRAGSSSAEPIDGRRWTVRLRGRERMELFLTAGLSSVRIEGVSLDRSRTPSEVDVELPAGGVAFEVEDEPPGLVELIRLDTGARVARIAPRTSGITHVPFLAPGPYLLVVDGVGDRMVEVPARGVADLGELRAR